MSKLKKNPTTTTLTQNKSDLEGSVNSSSQNEFIQQKRRSTTQQFSTSNTSTISSNTASSNTVLINQNFFQMKKRTNKPNTTTSTRDTITSLMENSSTETEFSKSTKILPSFYCININQDGYRNMDKASHLNNDEIENKKLEFQLRPISGIRNHLRRNMTSNQPNLDIMKDTDLIQRIGSVKTLKRLDLSFNNLQAYPRQLCDLNLLESLNLSGNNLCDTDFPNELEKYQNLIELVLDSNQLKRVPKQICKFKKLLRLSIRKNSLVDFKNLENFKRLRYLTLDYNSLSVIDDSIKSLDKLEILYLSHNLIQTLHSNLFKSSLNNLKQLDLSFNKLQSISTELFMLPHLESLNLSNNSLSRLPSVPMTYFRTQPIFSLDLSSNNLVRFYDYLLTLARNIDLSSNKIKTIPGKAILKLTEKQLNSKTLKLENNPLVEPPQEVCNYGIKYLKEYFEEASRQIQLNKGFKIIILGECKSGKTSLAYALEDLNSQSNLIEQFNVSEFEQTESKFIEIHEFYFNTEMEDIDYYYDNRSQSDIRPSSSASSIKSQKSDHSKRAGSSTSTNKTSKTISSKKIKINEELNAFSNLSFSLNSKLEPVAANSAESMQQKKSIIPVNVYDFNGSLYQFGHLMDLFLDKTGLVILCVDASNFGDSETGKNELFEKNLTQLLDSVLLKMSKNSSFCILPVLTKIDKINKLSSNYNIVKLLAQQVENFIKNHINNRLADIKADLKEIELLPQISASQSDRLKQLVQTQANLTPDIYKRCIAVSSIQMDGIGQLSNAIREIVFNSKKHFPDVNKKVPAFWTEVENYACNVLSEMPTTKYVDDRIKIVTSASQPSLSMLCVDYDVYKEKIVEKYGMSHLVDQITRYMNSNGKVIWYQDTEKLRQKVFLRPNVFFDLIFVLFRTNFNENFTDVHTQALRSKLVQNSANMSEDNIKILSNDLLKKGVLGLDLLKFLWFPILITDSWQIVQDAIMLLMDYFYIGYPALPKDKLKLLLQTYSKKNEIDLNLNDSIYSGVTINHHNNLIKQSPVTFSSCIVPFYLPLLTDHSSITRIKTNLESECLNASSLAVTLGIKKSKPARLSRMSQRYSFPWGLMSGVFEKFSVNCIINSDLYYKIHYKNFIYGYNEENTIGVIMRTNSLSEKDVCNEVVFEFFLVSYQQIIESLEQSSKDKKGEFEQTTEMDLDQIWIVALKILQLFEDTINYTYPSLRYDRWSLCPECEKFTFFGEWVTPKELQKAKSKNCPSCEKNVHYSYLVRPSTGQSLTLDMKRMQQRLENLARLHLKHNSMNTSQTKIDAKSNIYNDSNTKLKGKN